MKKSNAVEVLRVNHYYLSMFVTANITQSRTLRFFNVLAVILTTIFGETIFFGVYYPSHSPCFTMTDEVSKNLTVSYFTASYLYNLIITAMY